MTASVSYIVRVRTYFDGDEVRMEVHDPRNDKNDTDEGDTMIHAVLNIRGRDGEVVSQTAFRRDEVEMPGYVDSVIAGYADTEWSTEVVEVIGPNAEHACDLGGEPRCEVCGVDKW